MRTLHTRWFWPADNLRTPKGVTSFRSAVRIFFFWGMDDCTVVQIPENGIYVVRYEYASRFVLCRRTMRGSTVNGCVQKLVLADPLFHSIRLCAVFKDEPPKLCAMSVAKLGVRMTTERLECTVEISIFSARMLIRSDSLGVDVMRVLSHVRTHCRQVCF